MIIVLTVVILMWVLNMNTVGQCHVHVYCFEHVMFNLKINSNHHKFYWSPSLQSASHPSHPTIALTTTVAHHHHHDHHHHHQHDHQHHCQFFALWPSSSSSWSSSSSSSSTSSSSSPSSSSSSSSSSSLDPQLHGASLSDLFGHLCQNISSYPSFLFV